MRIFIYTRKSKWTGRGDSVENQLAMCREYIQHNIEGAQNAKIITYEDEGYSGKNTQRPQFQKMMSDIEADHCDYLVCYKLDRLGRNIADLANLIEFLNKEEVSFVSIKERFDTSTPIGKAMLYFAGVLAQMEREQIAERVRDNMIMLARKGRWLGGNTPLGFEAKGEEKIAINGKSKKSYCLRVNEDEIETVRFIFQNYLVNQSLAGIVKYFLNKGILTRRGKEYTTTGIKDILTNPVYCVADSCAYEYFLGQGCQVCMDEEEADGTYGLMGYAKTSCGKYKSKTNEPDKWIISLGRHKGLVPGKDFVKIQKILEVNKRKAGTYRKVHNPVSLLSGLLYCSCGHMMRPKNYSCKQVMENGDRRFSYLCPYKDMTHGGKCAVRNVQGNALDRLVCQEALRYTEENLNICWLLKKAETHLLSSKKPEITEIELMKQEILRKKREAKNLIAAIAKSGGDEAFIRQIEAEVTGINRRCKALEEQLESIKAAKKDMQEEKEQPVFSSERPPSFERLFEMLSVMEKREYLRIILDRVVWDGEEAHIYIRRSR